MASVFEKYVDDMEPTDDEQRNPLAHQPVAEAPTALADALTEYGSKRSTMDILKDEVKLIPALGKGLLNAPLEFAKSVAEDPRHAIAPGMQMVGAAAGALTGNPALAYAGSAVGRFVGEGIESLAFNRPFLNTQAVLNTANASMGSVVGTVAGGLGRGALRKAGVIAAEDAGKSLAPLTIERSAIPKGTDAPETLANPNFVGPVKTFDELHKETTGNILARRTAQYKDIEDKALNAPIYSYRRMGQNGSTVGDVVRDLVNNGWDFHEATEVALQREHQTRAAYSDAARIALQGYDDTAEVKGLANELQRVQKNIAKGQSAQIAPKLTKAQGKVFQGIEATRSQAEELARLNNQLFDDLPDYTKVNYETFRRIMEVAPDTTKHPLLKAIEKATFPGITARLWRLQTVLRKNNDPHLTHIADSFLTADELYQNTVRVFGQKSQDFFKAKALNDVDKIYLQKLENAPQLFAAIGKVDETLPLPDQLAHLRQLMPHETLDLHDVEHMRKGAATIREWQKEIGDPLYMMSLGLAKDGNTLPPLRQSYFTTTYTFENQLDSLKNDLAAMEARMNMNPNDPLNPRYADAAMILRNKIAIGTQAAERGATSLRRIGGYLNNPGVLPRKAFAPQLNAKTTQMGIGLNPEEGSMQYVRQVSKKMIYDRLRETSDATVRDWVKQQIGLGADINAVHSTARYVQDALLDQTGVRSSAQIENFKAVLRGSKLTSALVPHVERGIKDITTAAYIMTIALRPAFHMVNMMQNFLTLSPLVDTESFSHGLARTVYDWDKAYKEALDAGALDEGLNHLWRSDELGAGTGGKFARVAEVAGKGVNIVEARNRTMAFLAGKHNAELNGITGAEAVKRGLDTVAESNFLYSAAHRPIGFNRPLPAAILRYKSFGQNYGNFLGNLIRKKEYARAGTALAAVWATSGTTGIPFYSYVRAGAAMSGHYLPEVNNFEQATGLDMNIDPPFPMFSPEVTGSLGPFATQLDAGMAAITGEGDNPEGNVARAGRVLFPLGQKLAAGVAEQARGGITMNASLNTVKSQRTPEQIALSAVGLGPSNRKVAAQTATNLALSIKAKDVKAAKDELLRSLARGQRDQQEVIQRTKAGATNGRNRTVLGEYLEGYGPLR